MASSTPGTLSGLRGWPFVVLGGASLVLWWSDPTRVSASELQATVRVIIVVSGLALAVFLEVMARMIQNRQRLAPGYDAHPEAARAILDSTAGLTRVLNLAVAIFVSLLAVPSTWLPGLGPRGALSLGIAVIVAAMAWAVRSLKAVHDDLERAGRLGGLEGWNGVLYSNANDPRLWVPKISGYGTTLNFAHRRAWVTLASVLVLSLGAAAVGIVSAFCR